MMISESRQIKATGGRRRGKRGGEGRGRGVGEGGGGGGSGRRSEQKLGFRRERENALCVAKCHQILPVLVCTIANSSTASLRPEISCLAFQLEADNKILSSK